MLHLAGGGKEAYRRATEGLTRQLGLDGRSAFPGPSRRHPGPAG
ncbi:hypothetical protein ACRAWF_44075 [Streptomyces sp. L7]